MDATIITVPAKTLHNALKNVAYAMSQDGTYPLLCGSYLHCGPSGVFLEASDLHAVSRVMLDSKSSAVIRPFIAAGTVKALRAWVDDWYGVPDITIRISPTVVTFSSHEAEISSIVLAKDAPVFDSTFAQADFTTVLLTWSTFYSELSEYDHMDRVEGLRTRHNNDGYTSFVVSGGVLTVSRNAVPGGNTRERTCNLGASHDSAERYSTPRLMTALKNFSAKKIAIHLREGYLVITPEGETPQSHTQSAVATGLKKKS
jgi:hypothetical protein